MKNSIMLLFIMLSIHSSYAVSSSNPFFIENQGQWNDDVLFLTQTHGLNTWITKQGVVYDYYQSTQKKDIYNHPSIDKTGHIIRLSRLGGTLPTAIGNQKEERYNNYFCGKDSSQWTSNVGTFTDVTLQNIYEGIDMRYYVDGDYIRYDYIIQPHISPSQIKWELQGQDSYKVNEYGELQYATRFGDAIEGKIYCYQVINHQKQPVEGSYIKLSDGSVSIQVQDYNANLPLIVDPLIFSTFIGTTEYDEVSEFTLDEMGNSYLVGHSSAVDFPTSTGAYVQFGSSYNTTLIKLNADGSDIIFSSVIGGNDGDFSVAIQLDESGNIYIAGATTSSNFPTTPDAYSQTYGGVSDFFFVKLNPTGSELLHSTYLGGTDIDQLLFLKLDSTNQVYLGGYTMSPDFPTTSDAFDTTFNTGPLFNQDGVLLLYNPSNGELAYSTFFGGDSKDVLVDMTLANNGQVVLLGESASTDFPVTENAYSSNLIGSDPDITITQINLNNSELTYSTYIGGDGYDDANKILIDSKERFIIIGRTTTDDFPTTDDAYNTASAGYSDIVFFKLDTFGNLLYSTYIGGSFNDHATGIVIDSSENYIISGLSRSPNFPIVGVCPPPSVEPNGDAIIFKILASSNEIVYSYPLGGSQQEGEISMRLGPQGHIYLSGKTISSDFPTTTGAYSQTFISDFDVFVTKLDLPNQSIFTLPLDPQICLGESIELTAYGADNYTWSFGLGTDPVITVSPTETTTYTVSSTDSENCIHTQDITVSVSNNTIDTTITNNTPTLTANMPNVSYQWLSCPSMEPIPGETFASFTATTSGEYAVMITQGNCQDTSSCHAIDIVGTNDINSLNVLSIYPNPTSGNFLVELKKIFPATEVKITNTLGQIIFNAPFGNTSSIPLSLKETGVYFVQIFSQGQRVALFKILRE